MVEDVECGSIELQAETLRQLEVLGQGYVRFPKAGPDKSIASEVAETAQARRTEDGQTCLRGSAARSGAPSTGWVHRPPGAPPIRPSVMCSVVETGLTAVRTFVSATAEQVIATGIDTKAGIDTGLGAIPG